MNPENSGNCRILSFERAVYDPEAVRLAAVVFENRADISLAEREDRCEATLKTGRGGVDFARLCGEFCNEVLNQDLRLSLARKNRRIVEMMTAHILSRAQSPKRDALPAPEAQALEEEAKRLMTAIKGIKRVMKYLPAFLILIILPHAAHARELYSGPKDLGKCHGSSVEEIVSSYGRIWGDGVDEKEGIGQGDSRRIENALLDFSVCQALVARSQFPCMRLSNLRRYRKGYKMAGVSLKDTCIQASYRMPLLAYLGGWKKDPNACPAFAAANLPIFSREIGKKLGAPIPTPSAENFCSAISEGYDKICPAIMARQIFPRKVGSGCFSRFPMRLSDCHREGGNADDPLCALNLSLYRAIYYHHPKLCPSTLEYSCRSFMSPAKAKKCDLAAKRLGDVYCELYDAAAKRNGGRVIGKVSPEAAKELDSINKKIRAMKENGG